MNELKQIALRVQSWLAFAPEVDDLSEGVFEDLEALASGVLDMEGEPQ